MRANKPQQPAAKWRSLAVPAAVLLSLILQWIILELSMTPFQPLLARRLTVNLLNLAVTAIPTLILMALTGRPLLSCAVSDVFYYLLSLANKYVCDLHGAPIRISELATVGTGMDVLKGYRFYLPDTFTDTTLLLVLCLLTLAAARQLTKDKHLRRLGCRLTALLTGVLLTGAAVLCFTTGALRPEIAYNWPVAVREWGYPLCLVEDTLRYRFCTIPPEGYSPQAAAEAGARYTATPGDGSRPDVIVILNETFYDPAQFTALGLQTDVPYLDNFYSLTDVSRGKAMIPVGGTNSSEYELLTSNAKSMINASAPFNFLSFGGVNTVVSYMKSLGYETWALHDLGGTNYTRYKSWPEMGFDHVLFQKDFTYTDRYGSRYGTDAADYKQLIHCYEQGGDQPRFMYLLTYQNHGGWEQNDPEWDTVHCLTDLGSDTDVMSEYLTSIRMSDEALVGLLDYFRTCGRDVVVLMVGDHPPVFLTSRSDAWLTEHYTDEDMLAYIDRTATPYLIWRSTGDTSGWPETVTMSELIPMTLKTAGLPLSRYYSALLAQQAEYPVHINGCAVTPDRKLLWINTSEDMPAVVRDCLLLAYQNLQPAGDQQYVYSPDGQ